MVAFLMMVAIMVALISIDAVIRAALTWHRRRRGR
jgi:hypothetical protein